MTNETEWHNYLIWKICALAGPVYVVGEAISWAWLGGFLPPPAQNLSAEQVLAFYTDNNLRIRSGMMLTLFFAPFYYIWSSAVSKLMQRAEGKGGILSNIELMGGFATVIVTFASVAAWLSAALHTDQKTASDILTIHDYGWMWFNPTVMVTFFQFIAFGTVFLLDNGKSGLMPSWMSWFSFAMAGTLLLALLTPFFNVGPFAWHGLFTYYIGLGGYFLWIVIACYQVYKAICRLEASERI
jgi:hypothetical protein